MTIGLTTSFSFFSNLSMGQLPTGRDPGSSNNVQPNQPVIQNRPTPIPATQNQQGAALPERFNQEGILQRLRLLTHNSILPNDLNILLPLLRTIDSRRPSSTTDSLIRGGINLNLIPTGDGSFQSQTFPGRFSFQPQDGAGSIFVDNRGNDQAGNALPPVTYTMGSNGNLTLNNSRTEALLWTIPLRNLRAYKNIFGSYSIPMDQAYLYPQSNGSIYDQTNRRTYSNNNGAWQWVQNTGPLATTMAINQLGLIPNHIIHRPEAAAPPQQRENNNFTNNRTVLLTRRMSTAICHQPGQDSFSSTNYGDLSSFFNRTNRDSTGPYYGVQTFRREGWEGIFFVTENEIFFNGGRRPQAGNTQLEQTAPLSYNLQTMQWERLTAQQLTTLNNIRRPGNGRPNLDANDLAAFIRNNR